jgi:alkylation response protein AidB-like acyl-CoA dehydrogenase
MDLTLSDEQRLLRESVDRFIAETYDADHRRSMAGDPLGFSPAIWKQFAELGWLALPIARLHHLRRLVGNPARYCGEDGAGAVAPTLQASD